MVYCDTPVLVSAISAERFSIVARDWLDQRPQYSVAYSGWTDAEIASALAQKQHSGRVSAAERAQSLAIWRDLSRGMLRSDVGPDDFAQVARLVDSGARVAGERRAPPRGRAPARSGPCDLRP